MMAENGQLTPYKSPGVVKESRKSGQKNLTGSARKLKDMGAELHSIVTKWKSLNGTGSLILSDIVNTKLQYIYQQTAENTAEEEQMDASTLTQKLQLKCQALHCVIESMEDVVKKMGSLTSMVDSICSLSVHQGDSDTILFFSWTAHNFADTLNAIHAMYSKELRLKRELCQNVAYADTRSSLTCFSAAWLHEPNIDNRLMMALLQETGHTS